MSSELRSCGMVQGEVPGRRASKLKVLKQDKAGSSCTSESNSGWSAGNQASGARGSSVQSQGPQKPADGV